MAEPSNDDAAKALDRLTSPQTPTPQPKPRIVPTVKPQPAKPQPVKPGAAKAARPSAPVTKSTAAKPAKKPAPAPDLQQALAGARSASAGLRTVARPKSDPAAFQLTLKRTLIPILLTIGFILVSLGIVHFAWKSDDNPVFELPGWIVGALLVGGVLSWALAAINILSVRKSLVGRAHPV